MGLPLTAATYSTRPKNLSNFGRPPGSWEGPRRCKIRGFMDDRPRRLEDHDRVLLIRLGAVGDVLRTLPALHLIRSTYPALHVAWVVEDLSHDLLGGHPEIDEVLRFPRREMRSAAARPRHFAGLVTLPVWSPPSRLDSRRSPCWWSAI